MTVTQIAQFTNDFMSEITGDSNVVQEDLSNIVDAGNTVLSSSSNVENFLHAMTDRIARFEISNRLFNIPSVILRYLFLMANTFSENPTNSP